MGKERIEAEHDRTIVLAWTIELLQRQKKLPKLETLLRKRNEKQSVGQLRNMFQQISERYGLKMRKGSRVTKRA